MSGVRITRLQLELLALCGSGYSVCAAAPQIPVSETHAYRLLGEARIAFGLERNGYGGSIAGCVMRAFAIGLLSHPTGPEHRVFVNESTFLEPALAEHALAV